MTDKYPPPSSMSAIEKRAYRALITTLTAAGIDVGRRAELAADYVRLEARIEKMRSRENDDANPNQMATTRALNVATTERRRLHSSLFSGAQKVEPERPLPPPTTTGASKAEADRAWWIHFNRPPSERLSKAAFEAEEADLTARYGEPSWAPLLALTEEHLADLLRPAEA